MSTFYTYCSCVEQQILFQGYSKVCLGCPLKIPDADNICVHLGWFYSTTNLRGFLNGKFLNSDLLDLKSLTPEELTKLHSVKA